MNVVLPAPTMSREQFLGWVLGQEAPFEFDGSRPVPMTGGTRGHNLIISNVLLALRARLRGTPCTVLTQGAGVATPGGSVRYPDVLVTRTAGPSSDLLIPGVLVVFEVVSPSSERTDRITKLREYAAVPSIRRYVILEQESPAATVYARQDAGQPWTATALVDGEVLDAPELGIEIPIGEFYEDVAFSTGSAAAG